MRSQTIRGCVVTLIFLFIKRFEADGAVELVQVMTLECLEQRKQEAEVWNQSDVCVCVCFFFLKKKKNL